MTRAVFYLLASDTAEARQVFACRLAEKAYRAGHRVFIHTESAAQNRAMDDLLWTFRAGSFVPHGILEDARADPNLPVVIGFQPAPPPWREIVINLAPTCPPELTEGVGRLLEVLDRSDAIRQAGRLRYRQYQQQGFELEAHDMAPHDHT